MPPKNDKSNPGAGEEEAAPVKAAADPKAGLKPWLPLIANLVLMPVLAYATVTFVVKGQLSKPAHAAEVKGEAPGKTEAKEPAKGASHESKGAPAKKNKITYQMKEKVLANLAGTQGTRYLMVKITLVVASDEIKKDAGDKEDELRDTAVNVLRTKTISDLEKPGAINFVRAELISVFCNVLGEGAVTGILLTEFAVQ